MNGLGKKTIVVVVVLVLGVVALPVITYYFTPTAHAYLCMAPQLEKSDVVIVFAGGNGFRLVRAVQLLQKGYANKLVLSGTKPEIEFLTNLLNKHAATDKQRMFLKTVSPFVANSTKENVKGVVKLMSVFREDKVIVVTSWWHIRRCKILFDYYCSLEKKGEQIRSRCNFVHEKASAGPGFAQKAMGTCPYITEDELKAELDLPITERQSFRYYRFVWTEMAKVGVTKAFVTVGLAPPS